MTSRWARRVEALGATEVEWGVFSLEISNNEKGADGVDLAQARGIPVLRTALLVRDRFGNKAMGDYYAAIGHRIHDECMHASEAATNHAALADAGLDPVIFDEANADDATWRQLVREHTALVDATKSFGVPVIELASGRAIFGPVISEEPNDADALKLFDSTTFLTGYENFAEFKRERTVPLDLERARQHARKAAEKAGQS